MNGDESGRKLSAEGDTVLYSRESRSPVVSGVQARAAGGSRPVGDEAEAMLDVFLQIFSEDVEFLSVAFLCSCEVASLREVSRHVGMSHKNLAPHLERLASKGVVEVAYRRPNLRLYRLTERTRVLKPLLGQSNVGLKRLGVRL